MKLSLVRLVLVAGLVLLAQGPASAQSETPQQLQALIANGQEQTALQQLAGVIKVHPDSGVAWFLVAEAQDASGNETSARGALAKAQQLAPGLPFADPGKVAALQAHLTGNANAGPAAAPLVSPAPAATGIGISPLALMIGGVVVLFIMVRLFLRSRRPSMLPPGYRGGYGPNAPPPGAPYPYGPGGMPYSGGAMPGAGSSLLGGLAAGAGFVAGERILGDLTGGGGGLGGGLNPGLNNDPAPAPERDDGLAGSPNWDDGNAGGADPSTNNDGFDPGNNW